LPVAPLDLRAGQRVMAMAPDGEGDGAGDARWVPGRVIAERHVDGARQFKVSCDGYDSEDDVWVEAASSKVRLQQAAAGRHGATHATHANEEHAAARKRAEERRAQGYSRHREAMLSGERMAD